MLQTDGKDPLMPAKMIWNSLYALYIWMREKPDLPPERIPELAGYRTSTYFYKAFRQHFGKSPREWQKGKS